MKGLLAFAKTGHGSMIDFEQVPQELTSNPEFSFSKEITY
jgi:hypothetical protein